MRCGTCSDLSVNGVAIIKGQHLSEAQQKCSMCEFYCIAFIEFMIAGKTLLDYTDLLFSNGYQKNDKIIYKSFKEKYGKRKHKCR